MHPAAPLHAQQLQAGAQEVQAALSRCERQLSSMAHRLRGLRDKLLALAKQQEVVQLSPLLRRQQQAKTAARSMTSLLLGAAAGAGALSPLPVAHCAPLPSAATPSPAAANTRQSTQGIDLSGAGMTAVPRQRYQVVFVLGGPGSGKGTQCAKLVEAFGLVHLSAGDLLRAHMKSGSADGNMVADMIKQGAIVPSRVTVGLLEAAMERSGRTRFLIDGFPRNEENRLAFESQTGIVPEFVLFFDCPEAVMERRLLGRQEGRTDDNIETIRKRFKVFLDSTLPIIDHYSQDSRVRRIDADRSPDAVFADVRPLFQGVEAAPALA